MMLSFRYDMPDFKEDDSMGRNDICRFIDHAVLNENEINILWNAYYEKDYHIVHLIENVKEIELIEIEQRKETSLQIPEKYIFTVKENSL